MNANRLLLQVAKISEKYALINQQTGKKFNVFEIADIASEEVTMCRVLYELLNPQGSHGQGDRYLKLFFDTVLNPIELPPEEIAAAKIYREYAIENSRRIDLVIKTKSCFIPIEVKIFADDQQRQCYDYWIHAKKQYGDHSQLYYLTRFGDAPTKESYVNELVRSHIRCISWSSDIINWLDSCLSCRGSSEIAPVREVIIQLMRAIRGFTGLLEEESEVEMCNIIMTSKESLSAALEISRSIPLVKSNIMKFLYNGLISRFEQSGYTVSFYSGDGKIDEYFKSNAKTTPYLFVKITSFGNYDVVLGVETNWNLFFYFGFLNHADKDNHLLDISEVGKEFPQEFERLQSKVFCFIPENQREKTIYWDYICNPQGEQYNLRQFSKSCIELLDNEAEVDRIFYRLKSYIDGARDY